VWVLGMSHFSNLDSSEGIVTGRWGGQMRTLASIPCKGNCFISLTKVLNPLWGPAGLLFSNKGYYCGVKRPGLEACHLPSSRAKAKNKCSYTYTSPPVCPLAARKDKFTPCPYIN